MLHSLPSSQSAGWISRSICCIFLFLQSPRRTHGKCACTWSGQLAVVAPFYKPRMSSGRSFLLYASSWRSHSWNCQCYSCLHSTFCSTSWSSLVESSSSEAGIVWARRTWASGFPWEFQAPAVETGCSSCGSLQELASTPPLSRADPWSKSVPESKGHHLQARSAVEWRLHPCILQVHSRSPSFRCRNWGVLASSCCSCSSFGCLALSHRSWRGIACSARR